MYICFKGKSTLKLNEFNESFSRFIFFYCIFPQQRTPFRMEPHAMHKRIECIKFKHITGKRIWFARTVDIISLENEKNSSISFCSLFQDCKFFLKSNWRFPIKGKLKLRKIVCREEKPKDRRKVNKKKKLVKNRQKTKQKYCV